MQLQFICPYWGQEHLDADAFIRRVVQAGYNGVEVNVPETKGFAISLLNAIKENELLFIAQQWLPPAKETVEQYIKRFSENLYRLAALQPLFINSHTGKDHFSFEDNCRIIEHSNRIAAETGIPVVHEIHRGRFTFHATTLLPYLKKFPDLQLTADVSHWCIVSESMLEDQDEMLQTILPHTTYMHARVGFEQGPQVNDPRAPEWNAHVQQYLHWWDEIIAHQRNQTAATFHICPEFGPMPYMPQAPFTKEPLSDQWTVNGWMMQLLKERYTSTTNQQKNDDNTTTILHQ